MGVISLAEDMLRAVERAVAEGHAESVEAFVEDAVFAALLRTAEPSEELVATVRAGEADIAAGRYVTLRGPGELGTFLDGLLEEASAGRRAAS